MELTDLVPQITYRGEVTVYSTGVPPVILHFTSDSKDELKKGVFEVADYLAKEIEKKTPVISLKTPQKRFYFTTSQIAYFETSGVDLW
jgi:hypothetical protein